MVLWGNLSTASHKRDVVEGLHQAL